MLISLAPPHVCGVCVCPGIQTVIVTCHSAPKCAGEVVSSIEHHTGSLGHARPSPDTGPGHPPLKQCGPA